MSSFFPDRTIYLAGPISGLTDDEARYGWRRRFADMMPPHIHCNSPMRGKDFLRDVGVLDANVVITDNPMETDKGIMTRDTNDVRISDAVVMCFLESGGRISVGTQQEIGMAHYGNKPMVIVADPKDPNVDHPMTRAAGGYMVGTLEEAAVIVTKLLTPGI